MGRASKDMQPVRDRAGEKLSAKATILRILSHTFCKSSLNPSRVYFLQILSELIYLRIKLVKTPGLFQVNSLKVESSRYQDHFPFV